MRESDNKQVASWSSKMTEENKLDKPFWTKGAIEILWSSIAGMCFVVFVQILENGSSDEHFTWESDIFRASEWFSLRFGPSIGHNTENFLFGFIVTFIIIWSIKRYHQN